MQRFTGLLAILSLATGCQVGGNLGGGDPGWQYDEAPFGASEPDSAESDDVDSGFSNASGQLTFTDETCTDDEDADNVLAATVEGSTVTVLHQNIGTWCEASWLGSYTVDAIDPVIYVTYEDVSGTTEDTAECWCHWDLTYTLDGLAAGEWTLYALDESTTFTLE